MFLCSCDINGFKSQWFSGLLSAITTLYEVAPVFMFQERPSQYKA